MEVKTTGTFQDVWTHLSYDDRKRIAMQALRHIGHLRKSRPATRCEGMNGGAFLLRSSFLNLPLDAPQTPTQPCSTDDELWECVFLPPLQRNGVPEDEQAFFRENMPPNTEFVFTQMDLTAKNVLVKEGNFAGFASHHVAGYYPEWFQCVALRLFRQGVVTRVELKAEGHAGDDVDGDAEWLDVLIHGLKTTGPENYPFQINRFGVDHGHQWFQWWFIIQLGTEGQNNPHLKKWQEDIRASRKAMGIIGSAA